MRLADHKVICVLDPSYSTSKLYTILDVPEITGNDVQDV